MHTLNTKIAKDFDVNMAIVITMIGEITSMAENGKIPVEGFVKREKDLYMRPRHLFGVMDYFSQKQLKGIVNRGISEGLLKKGDFNRNKFENTIWVTLSDKAWDYLTS